MPKPITAHEPFARELFYHEDRTGDIWLTVPKCGLSSVRDFMMPSPLDREFTTVDEVKVRMDEGRRLIMTVRDPMDRLISAWHMVRDWQVQYPNFNDFAAAVDALDDDDRDCHVMTQTSFLRTESGDVLVPTNFVRTDKLHLDLEAYRMHDNPVRKRNQSHGQRPLNSSNKHLSPADRQLWARANRETR